jgi:thiamine-monophosphate kinase
MHPVGGAREIKPTSMIDISGGSSSEIMPSKQSGVGCNLYEDKLPLDPQLPVCEYSTLIAQQ